MIFLGFGFYLMVVLSGSDSVKGGRCVFGDEFSSCWYFAGLVMFRLFGFFPGLVAVSLFGFG